MRYDPPTLEALASRAYWTRQRILTVYAQLLLGALALSLLDGVADVPCGIVTPIGWFAVLALPLFASRPGRRSLARMMLVLAGGLAAFTAAATAGGAGVVYRDGVVRISGEISHALPTAFLAAAAAAIADGGRLDVELDSIGGRSIAADLVALQIRAAAAAGVPTSARIGDADRCGSACPRIFLAAAERTAHPRALLMFHATSGYGRCDVARLTRLDRRRVADADPALAAVLDRDGDWLVPPRDTWRTAAEIAALGGGLLRLDRAADPRHP